VRIIDKPYTHLSIATSPIATTFVASPVAGPFPLETTWLMFSLPSTPGGTFAQGPLATNEGGAQAQEAKGRYGRVTSSVLRDDS
jgi:hypothetical protein